jgi:hypothetical protein
MYPKVLNKTAALVVTVALATPMAGASAASPSLRSIPTSQAEKIYLKAKQATDTWTERNPHTKSIRTVDVSDGGRVVEDTSVTIDREGDLKFVEDREVFYIVGEYLYLTFDRDDMLEVEYEIAVDLGLDLEARYAKSNPQLVDPDYSLEMTRNRFRASRIQPWSELTGGDPRSTKTSYRKTGTTEYLKVSVGSTGKNNTGTVRTTEVKMERGRIVSQSTTQNTAGAVYKATLTVKPFSGDVVEPAGPYLELDEIVSDPRFADGYRKAVGERILDAIVREAQAIAALNERDVPIAEDWAEVLSDYPEAAVYDRGIRFNIFPDGDRAISVCGVFAGDGAELEMRSCEDLGFVAE